MTVADMDRVAGVLHHGAPASRRSRTSRSRAGLRAADRGLRCANAAIVRLRLGDEMIELTEFLAPRGTADARRLRRNDRVFQHIAIIVSDMERRTRGFGSTGSSTHRPGHSGCPTGTRTPAASSAFYFRDPDGHFLEVLRSRRQGAGAVAAGRDRLFLGIDHTAIVVDDTDRTLSLYRDILGLQVAGASENYDIEQEHLNNVFGARLRITALRAQRRARASSSSSTWRLATAARRPPDLRANDSRTGRPHWSRTAWAPCCRWRGRTGSR